MLAVAALAAWGLTACAPGSSSSTADPVRVELTFTGELSGAMTTADKALQPGSDNPVTDLSNLPAHTQCSTFDSGAGKDFVASVTGLVNGQRVRLSIEINASSPAYTSPGSALEPGVTNDGGSTDLQLPGDATPRYSVLGPGGQEPATMVLQDQHTGTIDAWYEDAGYSQKDARDILHVSGTWRCP